MATITRTQHVQYLNADMLAVKGKGTVKFQKSNAPSRAVKVVSAVFDGRVRITRLANGRGYNFVALDLPRGSDRRRVHFQGDALVRVGGEVMEVSTYYTYLEAIESLRKRLGV